jgi:hypothetical protein
MAGFLKMAEVELDKLHRLRQLYAAHAILQFNFA